MNLKKIAGGLLIVLITVCADFGQQLEMKQNGNVVRVVQGKKLLYKVVLRGKPNDHKQKYDEAFLAGSCLIVRRDVREEELYPLVSRLEIYQMSGKRKIYREKELGIRRLDGIRVLTSPDFSWAVIPDEEEGEVSGYFYVSPQCRISEEGFSGEGTFFWDDVLGGDFIDNLTLKFPSMTNELSNGEKKKVAIIIGKDNKTQIQEIKQ